MKYAGIGSRETPVSICNIMSEIALKLDNLGHILYSGGALGADEAFEKGAKNKIVFLPWNGFNNKYSDNIHYIIPDYNEELIRKYHPKFSGLSSGALKLMSRNSYQVLGLDLKSPVDFIICWTKDGKASGGTGQALRIAKDYKIPIFNLKNENELDNLNQYIQMIDFFT